MKIRFPLLVILLTSSIWPATVASNISTATVYTTVVAGVAGMASGQTLVIFDGLYSEQITVTNKTNCSIYSWRYYTNGNNSGVYFSNDAGTSAFTFTSGSNNRILGITFQSYTYPINIIAKNTTVSGCNFYGDGIYQTWGVLANSGSVNAIISNCTLSNQTGYNIYFTSSTNSSAVGLIARGSTGDALRIDNSINSTVSNCVIFSAGGIGINVTSNSGATKIFSNYIYSCTSYGIQINSNVAPSIIYSNFLSNNGAGIILSSNTTSNTVSFNSVYGGLSGVFLNDSGINTVSSNTIKSTTSAGILLMSTGICSNNTITGNIVLSNNSGIFLSNEYSTTVTGNNLSSNNTGILVTNSLSNQITGNLLSSNLTAMNLLGGNYLNIINNSFYLNSVGAVINKGYSINFGVNNIYSNVLMGILITNGASNSTYVSNRILNNSNFGIYAIDCRSNVFARNYIEWNSNGMTLSGAVFSNIIINNVFAKNTNGLWCTNTSTAAWVINNLFYSNFITAYFRQGANAFSNLYNCYFGSLTNTNNMNDTFVSNLFVNPLVDDGTYRPAYRTSPIIDTGYNFNVYTQYYFGGGPDIGWWESLLYPLNATNLTYWLSIGQNLGNQNTGGGWATGFGSGLPVDDGSQHEIIGGRRYYEENFWRITGSTNRFFLIRTGAKQIYFDYFISQTCFGAIDYPRCDIQFNEAILMDATWKSNFVNSATPVQINRNIQGIASNSYVWTWRAYTNFGITNMGIMTFSNKYIYNSTRKSDTKILLPNTFYLMQVSNTASSTYDQEAIKIRMFYNR